MQYAFLFTIFMIPNLLFSQTLQEKYFVITRQAFKKSDSTLVHVKLSTGDDWRTLIRKGASQQIQFYEDADTTKFYMDWKASIVVQRFDSTGSYSTSSRLDRSQDFKLRVNAYIQAIEAIE